MNNKVSKRWFLAFLMLFTAFTTGVPVFGSENTENPVVNAEVSPQHSKVAEHKPGLFDVDYGILLSQTLNFLILLFVLKKLLFEKVSVVLENRQKEIGKLRLDAEKIHEDSLKLKRQYQDLIDNIEEKAYEVRQKAIQETKRDVQSIIEDAKKKAEGIVEKGEMDLFMERQTAWAQIREQLVHLTTLATEKVLEDSLNDEMHRKIIERSIEKIEKDLPDHTKQ